jgi:endonuclease/exonuclease/phosphatase family metal-dependent hydrolase
VSLRIATYNVLHGMPVLGGVPSVPRDASGRPTGPPVVDDDAALRSAIAMLDADVLGLQEIDVHQPRSGMAHQVRAAADAMDAEHWRFAPAVVGTPGEHGWRPATTAHEHTSGRTAGHRPDSSTEVDRMGPLYGVGLVSRRPVLEWRTRRFDAAPWSLPLLIPGDPRPQVLRVPDEPRAAIAAVIEGERQPFTVVTTHLSFVPGYNVRQLRELRRWVADLPRPLLVIGDFNLPGSLPRRISGFASLFRGATYPSMRPRVQLDHVLADGLTNAQLASAHGQVHLLPVSDHAAVTVDVDL